MEAGYALRFGLIGIPPSGGQEKASCLPLGVDAGSDNLPLIVNAIRLQQLPTGSGDQLVEVAQDPAAQPERRGGAGPAGNLLGGKDPTGHFREHDRDRLRRLAGGRTSASRSWRPRRL